MSEEAQQVEQDYRIGALLRPRHSIDRHVIVTSRVGTKWKLRADPRVTTLSVNRVLTYDEMVRDYVVVGQVTAITLPRDKDRPKVQHDVGAVYVNTRLVDDWRILRTGVNRWRRFVNGIPCRQTDEGMIPFGYLYAGNLYALAQTLNAETPCATKADDGAKTAPSPDGWRPVLRLDGSALTVDAAALTSITIPRADDPPVTALWNHRTLTWVPVATERRLRALQRVVRVVHAKLEHRIDLGAQNGMKSLLVQRDQQKAIDTLAERVHFLDLRSQETALQLVPLVEDRGPIKHVDRRVDLAMSKIEGIRERLEEAHTRISDERGRQIADHDAINVLRNRAQSIEQRVDELAQGIEHARSRDHLQVQGQNEIVRDLASLVASVTLTRNRADRHEARLVEIDGCLNEVAGALGRADAASDRHHDRIDKLITNEARTNTIAWVSLALGLVGWLVAGLAWAGVIAP